MFYKIWQLKHMLADYLKHISEELKILHIQLRCLAIDTGSGTIVLFSFHFLSSIFGSRQHFLKQLEYRNRYPFFVVYLPLPHFPIES